MDNDFISWCQIINSCDITDLLKALDQGMHFIQNICYTCFLPEPFIDQTPDFCYNTMKNIIQKMFSIACSYDSYQNDEVFNYFYEFTIQISLKSLGMENSYFILLFYLFNYSDEYEQSNKSFVDFIMNLLFSATDRFQTVIEIFQKRFPLPLEDYATFYFLIIKFQSINEELKQAAVFTAPQFFNTLSIQNYSSIRSTSLDILILLGNNFLDVFLSSELEGDELFPFYDFLKKCIQCDSVEKQLFGAHYFANIYNQSNENCQGMLLQWFVNNNFFANLVNNKPHYEIIKTLIDLFDKMSSNQFISNETIYDLWGQSRNAQVSVREIYFIAISHCLQSMSEQCLSSFLEMVDGSLDLEVLAQFYKTCVNEMSKSNEGMFSHLLELASEKLDFSVFKKIFVELISLKDEKITKKINELARQWIDQHIFHLSVYDIIGSLFKESTIRLAFSGKTFIDYVLIGVRDNKKDTQYLYNLLLLFLNYYKICLPLQSNIQLFKFSEKPPFWTFMSKLLETRDLEATEEHVKLVSYFIEHEDINNASGEFIEFMMNYYIKFSLLVDNSIKKAKKGNGYCLLNPNDILSYLFSLCGSTSNSSCASKLTKFLLSLFLNSKMDYGTKTDYFVNEFISIIEKQEENSSQLPQVFQLLLSFIDSEEGRIDLSIFNVHRVKDSNQLFTISLPDPKGEQVQIRITPKTSILAIKNVLSALFKIPVKTISIDADSIPRNYEANEEVHEINVNYKNSKSKKNIINYKQFPVFILSTPENTKFLIEWLKNDSTSSKIAYKLLNRFIFSLLDFDQSPDFFDELFTSTDNSHPYYFKYMSQRFYKLIKDNIVEIPEEILNKYLEEINRIVLTKQYESRFLVSCLDILVDYYTKKASNSTEICTLLEVATTDYKYIYHYLRLIQKLMPEEQKIVFNSNTLIKLIKLITNQEIFNLFSSIIEKAGGESSLYSLIISIITNPVSFNVCENYMEQIVYTILLKIPESVVQITEQIVSLFNINQVHSIPILCKVLKALFSPEFKNEYDLTDFVLELLSKCVFLSNDNKLQKSIFDLSIIFNDDLQDSYIMSCCSIPVYNFNKNLFSRPFKTMSGLSNLGCTCYMNSILQLLSASNVVIASLLQQELREDIQNLLPLFCYQRFGMRNYYSTVNYCDAYAKFNTEFQTHEQEDAVEYFSNMVLGACPRSTVNLFEGKFKGIISRGEANVRSQILSEHEEIFTTVDVAVSGYSDLCSSLKQFLAPEKLAEYSTGTGEKVEALKYTRFYKLPRFLVFHLKRFEYNLTEFTRYKINSRFEFPTTLNMSEFSEEGCLYRLKGVVIHMGVAEGGHYVCVVKRERKWVLCDDSNLREISEDSFLNDAYGSESSDKSAYLLLFECDENEGENNGEVSDNQLWSLLPEQIKNDISENNITVTKECSLLTKSCYDYFLNRNPSEISINYFFNALCHSTDTERIVEFSKHIGDCKSYIMNSINELAELLSKIIDGSDSTKSIINLVGKSTDLDCIEAFLSINDKIVENNSILKKVGRIFNIAAEKGAINEHGFNMIFHFIVNNFSDKENIESFDLAIYFEVLIYAQHIQSFDIEPLFPIFSKQKRSDFQLLSTLRLLLSRNINENVIDEIFADKCDKLQIYKLISYLTMPEFLEQTMLSINNNDYQNLLSGQQKITIEETINEMIALIKNGSNVLINVLNQYHQIIIDFLLNSDINIRKAAESLVVALFLLRHSDNNTNDNTYQFENYIPISNRNSQNFVDDLIINIMNLPSFEERFQETDENDYINNFKLLAYFKTLSWFASRKGIRFNISSEIVDALSILIDIISQKEINPNYNLFEICRFVEMVADEELDNLVLASFKAFFVKNLIENSTQNEFVNFVELFIPIISSFEKRDSEFSENLLKSKQFMKICKHAASIEDYHKLSPLDSLAKFIISISKQNKEYRKRFKGIFVEKDEEENEYE